MKKKLTSARKESEGAKLKSPKTKKVIPNERVEEMAKDIRQFTYGQCLILKRVIDPRLAHTRE